MNSSNDLPDVAALLKELECSPAWQELKAANAASIDSNANHQSHTVALTATTDVSKYPASHSASATAPVPSVAALLSQLSSTTRSADPIPSTSSSSFSHYDYGQGQSSSTIRPSPIIPLHSFAPSAVLPDDRESLQKYSFRQSLPVLSELGEDPAFVATIKKMKTDQDQLERKLWADREAIYTKYQDKIKVVQTKAQMIGGTVSQHEITMISDAFQKEIFKFDNERVLPAWDGLISRQQGELAQRAVPTMFVTSDMEDRKTQQQVISVLENIASPTKGT